MKMAFCIKCGTKVPADAEFCPECGARMVPTSPKATLSKKKKPLIESRYGTVAMVVALVSILLMFMGSFTKSETTYWYFTYLNVGLGLWIFLGPGLTIIGVITSQAILSFVGGLSTLIGAITVHATVMIMPGNTIHIPWLPIMIFGFVIIMVSWKMHTLETESKGE